MLLFALLRLSSLHHYISDLSNVILLTRCSLGCLCPRAGGSEVKYDIGKEHVNCQATFQVTDEISFGASVIGDQHLMVSH